MEEVHRGCLSSDESRPGEACGHDLHKALLAVASLPVAFVLAMVIGEGLVSMLGYEPGGEEAVPLGPALLASTPALLILLVPCAAAVLYGYRG